jgi:hypothetical protein
MLSFSTQATSWRIFAPVLHLSTLIMLVAKSFFGAPGPVFLAARLFDRLVALGPIFW